MNSKNHFNSSTHGCSREPETSLGEGYLSRIMSGESIGVTGLSESIEKLRVEAADSFTRTSPEECEHWVHAFQYGYWLSQLETAQHIDEKVQQIVEFELSLGKPPELPKYGVELQDASNQGCDR